MTPVKAGGFASGGFGSKITQLEQPNDDVKRRAHLEYQEHLRLQVETKRREKEAEIQRQKDEEQREQDRLEKERLRLQAAFEADERRVREKEEEARRDQEERVRQAAEKRKQAEAQRLAADEALEKRLREQVWYCSMLDLLFSGRTACFLSWIFFVILLSVCISSDVLFLFFHDCPSA